MIPTKDNNPNGLHGKYVVTKTNGTPVDPDAEYFVLRVDGEEGDRHWMASRMALALYADLIECKLPKLAKDLRERYGLPDSIVPAMLQFAEKTWKVHEEKGFAQRELNHGEQIALIHSELSEALEGIRRNLMDDKLPERPMAEVELADVIIRILNYSTHAGFDVVGAVVEKNAFNATRSRMHGGKAF